MSNDTNSTQPLDETSTADSIFDSFAGDMFPNEAESTLEVVEDTEELEGEEVDQADEDAVDVDEDVDEEAVEDEESEDDEDLPEEELDEAGDEEAEEVTEEETDDEYWATMIPVKIDGEESEATLQDLVKGFQTNQSQTKRGQELAEKAKELDAKNDQVEAAMVMSYGMLQEQETADVNILQKMYGELDEALKDEYSDAKDTQKLQHRYNQAHAEYTKRKAGREGKVETMRNQLATERQEHFQESLGKFNTDIVELIPDWSEDLSTANIEYAKSLGISDELLNSSAALDPTLVKVLDDMRRAANVTKKGTSKRKKALLKRPTAAKPTPKSLKKENTRISNRKKVATGKSTGKEEEALFNDFIDGMFED